MSGLVFFKKSRMESAIDDGNVRDVEKLLDLGVSPDLRIDWYGPCLIFAIEKGNRDIAKLLMERGADTSPENDYMRMALHKAAAKGSIEIVELLVKAHPAFLKVKSHEGNTPLHIAAMYGHAEVVAFLLKQGADPAEKNFENRTAYFLAQKHYYRDVMDILPPPKKPDPLTAPVMEIPKAPAQSQILPPSPWKKLSDDKIAYVSTDTGIGYRITEIFNFRSRERIRIVHNLDTKSEAVETKNFDDIAETTVLEEALLQLQKLGGKPSRPSVSRIDKKPPSL